MDIRNTDYQTQYDWEDTIHIKGGETSVVALKGGGSYLTPFVEVYIPFIQTFIRGEGETVPLAEKHAWEQYKAILNCSKHEFERRDYRNGVGVCKHCNFLQDEIFEPLDTCIICGENTYWIADKEGNIYCEKHEKDIPYEKMTEYQKLTLNMR